MGPVTTGVTTQSQSQLTYEELEKVLNSEEGGDVTLTEGKLRNVRRYLGDDRNVTVEEMKERFSGSSDVGTMSADTGTWVLDCRTLPLIDTEVCTKITFNAYTWGIEFDLVVYGYPVVGAGIGYKDGLASFKFNVPKLPVKGELTIGASQLGGCDASLDAEVEFKVSSAVKVGPFGGSHPVEYC